MFLWLSSLGPAGTIATIYFPVFLPIIIICQIIFSILTKLIFKKVIITSIIICGFIFPFASVVIYSQGVDFIQGFMVNKTSLDFQNKDYPLNKIVPGIYEKNELNSFSVDTELSISIKNYQEIDSYSSSNIRFYGVRKDNSY